MEADDDLMRLMAALGAGSGGERDRASAELLRLIMVFVRSQMGEKLRRARESEDVCQSVAKSVVADLGGGKFELRSEGELVEYLKSAVRHKLIDLARMDGAAKREGDRVSGGLPVEDAAADASEERIESAEFLAVWNELSAEERELAALRLRGMEWDQIAVQTGKSAAGLRQQWSRLVKRLRPQ